MTNIIIAEDDRAFRGVLREILSKEKDFNIVAFADTEDEVVDQAIKNIPEIIIMDIQLKKGLGINAVRRIEEFKRKENRDIKIIILSAFYNKKYVEEAIELSVCGYLLKENIKENLVNTIKNTIFGTVTYDKKVTDVSKQKENNSYRDKGNNLNTLSKDIENKLSVLSKKEKEVISYIAKGYTNKDIAKALFITPGRVKNIITNINTKIGTNNGKEIAVFGHKARL